MTRDEDVTSMLAEEVEGTVLSIQAKYELIDAGETIAPSYPLETEYRTAYQAIIDAGGAEAAARTAGSTAVLDGFNNGSVVTSTNPPTTYPVYYGNAWDAAHPTP